MSACEIVPFDPAVLTGLLDNRFAVSVAVAALADAQLFPDELAYIEGAVAKRRAEFTTARLCARNALSELGVAPCALVPGPDRAPRWPSGVTGSISHTHGACAVAVTTAPEIMGLGIDIEGGEPFPDELVPMIFTASEREWLASMPLTERPQLAKTVFSAKEAVYKCIYALNPLFLDFSDVEIEFTVDDNGAFCGAVSPGRFTAAPSRASRRAPAWLVQLRGRFQSVRDFVITVAVLEKVAD